MTKGSKQLRGLNPDIVIPGQQTDMGTGGVGVAGGRGEVEMYGESNTEIYNTICKLNSQWGFAV